MSVTRIFVHKFHFDTSDNVFKTCSAEIKYGSPTILPPKQLYLRHIPLYNYTAQNFFLTLTLTSYLQLFSDFKSNRCQESSFLIFYFNRADTLHIFGVNRDINFSFYIFLVSLYKFVFQLKYFNVYLTIMF